MLVVTLNPQVPNPRPTPIALLNDQNSKNNIYIHFLLASELNIYFPTLTI